MSITPCRLFDTRPAPDTIGNRNTPLNAGEDFERQVWGTNGNCTIPTTATGISYNLTVPTGINGFLTVYPADAARPLSSNINPVAGEGVKANGGIVGLSATGAIKVYTLTGPLNALLDITGYFLPAGGGGGVGPAGPIGPAGPPGAAAVGGVDFGSGPGSAMGPLVTSIVLASVSVTAPSAGFVVVSATGNVLVNATSAVRCDISTASSAASGEVVQTTGGASLTIYSKVRGFPVPAGASTFSLVCWLDGGASASVFQPFITAVFSATQL